MKKITIFSLIILTVIICFLFFPKPQPESPPLNLVIISIDTLRADHMGVYGYKKNTTPSIDNWAKDAYVFTNAVTNIPHTYPSFTELFTGKLALDLNVVMSTSSAKPIDANTDTLAKILKKNGYSTAGFFSNYFLSSEYTNLNSGFDIYNRRAYSNTSNENFQLITSDALSWMDKNKNNKFFLWVHFMDPHRPYEPPPNLRCKFDAVICSLVSSDDQINNLEYEATQKYQFCQPETVPQKTRDLLTSLYEGDIVAADSQTGIILDRLHSLGLDKNTIVLFHSDHGEGFDHNYYFGHGGVLYDSSVKIPLIIRHPNNLTGQKKSNQLVDMTDIFPTLLALLNIKSPNNKISGISFDYVFDMNPLLSAFPGTIRNLSIKNRDVTYLYNHILNKYAVYDGRFKYIRSLQNACLFNNQQEELYDTKNDPEEKINIINSSSRINHLKPKLETFLSNYNLPQSKDELINKSQTGTDKYDNPEIIDQLKKLGY